MNEQPPVTLGDIAQELIMSILDVHMEIGARNIIAPVDEIGAFVGNHGGYNMLICKSLRNDAMRRALGTFGITYDFVTTDGRLGDWDYQSFPAVAFTYAAR